MKDSIANNGKIVSPTNRFPVQNIVSGDKESISGETVTLNGKTAAGGIVTFDFDKNNILALGGSVSGSYWGKDENKMWDTTKVPGGKGSKVTALTKTPTAADITIVDLNNNLENLFESATTARYILRVGDTSGNSLYGWIEAIAATSGTYVIDIYNTVGLGAQSWVGDLTAFTHTSLAKAEIFKYSSTVVWGSASIFSKEVNYVYGQSESEFANKMSNGEYAIDYENGKGIGRRITTGATETVSYDYFTQSTTVGSITGSGLATEAKQDTQITAEQAILVDTGVIAADTTSLDAKAPALGTAVMAASIPVTIASDDTLTGASGVLLTTIAGDTTSIDGKTPALGQAAKAAAVPVTMASDQISTYSLHQSSALTEVAVVKTEAGTLFKGDVQIPDAQATNTYYLQFLNATSKPADGAVTHLRTPVEVKHASGGGSSIVSFDFTGDDEFSGLAASTGIVLVLSTTEFTKTETGDIGSFTIFYN